MTPGTPEVLEGLTALGRVRAERGEVRTARLKHADALYVLRESLRTAQKVGLLTPEILAAATGDLRDDERDFLLKDLK